MRSLWSIGPFLIPLALVGMQAADQVSRPGEPGTHLTSPSPASPRETKSFKERLAAAESVKVETSLLGLQLDSTSKQAHEILDPLGTSTQLGVEPTKRDEKDESERKVLWRLTKSDFSSILVRIDEKERIAYIMGLRRPGKEIPFTQIGETEKAPILTEHTAAWDVVRPDKSLVRVVARGEKNKASAITIFVVKRSPEH